MLGDPLVVDAPEHVGQLGREHQADGDGLTVAQVVPPGGLERVGRACGRS